MQAAHAQFGIGGILGPVWVGALGYRRGFILLAFLSTTPLIISMSHGSITTFGAFFQSRYIERRGCAIDGEEDGEDCTAGTESPYASVLANDEEALKAAAVTQPQNKVSSSDAVPGDEESSLAVFPLPMPLKFLLASFFFVYVGMEIGFAGWISSYVIMTDLTDSRAKAAYATSVFFSTLAVGRVLAIPLAVYVSNTTMLRVQLTVTVISAVLVVVLAPLSYTLAVFSSAMMGLACSSLFPLVMTLVGDYGYTM